MAPVTVPSLLRPSCHALLHGCNAKIRSSLGSHPHVLFGDTSIHGSAASTGRSHWKSSLLIHRSACCRSASSEPLFPSQPEKTERFLSLDELLKEARELDEDFLFDADGTLEDSTGNIVDDPFARPEGTEDHVVPSSPPLTATVESVSDGTTLGSIYEGALGSSDAGSDSEAVKARRTVQVAFTCNKCSQRTIRLVNPLALTKGTVFVQCEGCEALHQLVDNLGLITEYDYRKERDSSL